MSLKSAVAQENWEKSTTPRSTAATAATATTYLCGARIIGRKPTIATRGMVMHTREEIESSRPEASPWLRP